MGLFDNDFTKMAGAMSKVVKLLDDLSKRVYNGDDVYANKEEFCGIAYEYSKAHI